MERASSDGMARLTVDQAREALPPLDELRPILDHLATTSQPDPARTWAGSGRLGTLGSRLVPTGVSEAFARLASDHAAALAEIYGSVAKAIDALERDDRPAAARALLEAAALEERRDRPDRAEAYAGAAHRLSRDARDDATTALALRRWARAARARGQLVEALDRYASAFEIARAIGEPRSAAEAAVGAGNVLEDQGRWEGAAQWYADALAALDPVQGPVPERWHALLNLHIVARSRGALEESSRLLERAQIEAGAVEPEASRPFLDNARGQLAMATGQFAAAEAHLRSALGATSSSRARVTIRLNLSEALLAQNRILEAAEQARIAEQEAILGGLTPKLPEVYRLLGRIASADREPDAFVLFERALELVRERALPPIEEAMTLQAYAEHEARSGRDDVAEDLRRDAEARFEALGISHMRRPWADVFAPSPNESLQP
jgi:tetratricopeptide (TPR) repeat protein